MEYILSDPTLLVSLREEISLAVSQGIDGPGTRLEQQFPRLRAVYLEVLRLTASSSTVRGVRRETKIGEKVLQTGSKFSSLIVSYIPVQTSLVRMQINLIRTDFFMTRI